VLEYIVIAICHPTCRLWEQTLSFVYNRRVEETVHFLSRYWLYQMKVLSVQFCPMLK